ncbi:MAG: hypothetical protein ACRDOX_06480 [Nocardioides sp.]
MTEAIDRRSAAKYVAEVVISQELERAERVTTQRIRDRIQGIPPDRRHLVMIGDIRVEVIETAAVDEVLAS